DELLEETPLEPQEIAQLVPALRDALKGSQQQVSYVALICLNPFISLIAETHPTFFKNVVITFAAAVIDKLGDTRDKARDAALNVLLTMWISAASSGSVITTPLATIIKETAFGHKQWRAREQILQWIVNCTRRVSDFSIKQWLPYMVKLLEDPHEQVRETAKDRIVLLFSGAAAHAKLDLKRELEKHSVRAAITEYILSKMGSNYGEANDIDNLPDNMTEPIEEDYMNVGTQNEETSRQVEAIRPSSSADDIGVIRIESAKELEKEFQNLLTPFSGKESEQNWLIREKNINKLRSLTRGDAASQYPDAFMNGLKLIMGGILTSLTSLRTTLTLAASGLIKDLVSHLGTTMDPFADNLLANLLKMVQSTKKIVAQAATNSTNALFQYCSYHTRLVTQLWHAMEEKNIQLRTSTIGFVKIVIQTHADRRDTMERTGGVESLEKCVRKGLTDAAPKVREGCREVFWTFFEVWPERGEKSSSIGKSRRSSIPRSDSGASDNYSMSVDSPKSHIKSPVSNPSTLRSKSPAPPSMRSKSTTSKSPMKPSPNKNGSPNATQIQPRKLTIVEQLEHSDWTTRVEGLFNVAQFVVKRSLEPPSANKPGYDFKKTPLPPDEELGPILLNMLNDQNPKVIENFLAPNVITEMARVIRLENLIPRLILFANDDDKSEQSIIIQNLFPGVKNAIGTEHALLGLNKCLLLLNNSGTTQKKSSSGFVYTLPQKRKILNGLLVWFNEIIEPKLELVENDQELTGFLGDVDKYSLLTKRLIPLVNNTKETSENYEPLSRLLINLHKLDPDAFETILFSFEGKVVDLVGNMVGWEEELEEAEEEVLAEEQAKLKEEQEREWEQQQLERRLYEEQFIADQKNQLALLQQQQQEQLEKQQRERELKKQREREAQLRREREAQEQRERELQLQKEHEEQQQREHELQQQRLRELQQQREQKQQERELQKQKERELQKQRELEFQQQQREFELQQQREFELQQQREFELQQQRELELQHQRELELQKQREFEIQQQREIEIQQEREFELQQRELEIQQQREAELQRQREFELHQQHEYELHEREYEREMQSHLYARRPPPLQLQSSNKFSSQNSPLSQKNIIKDNINDWVENQRVPHLSQRGDDLRNPKEKDILREQEWARKNRPKTAEPHWLDPRPRDIDRARRAKTPTRENEYERRMYRENGNWDERERIKSRDTDMYERDDRYDDRRREFELDERGRRPLNDERSRMIKDKTPYKENKSREHEVNGRNQRFLRDSREDELDGRDRRPFPRGSNQNDFDERLGGKRSFKSSKSPDWDDKNGRPILKERDIRDNEWDDVSSRSSGKERDNDWEERSTRSVPRDLRDGDLDEKLSQHSSRDKRDQEWDDRMNRLRPRESRESLEGKNTRPSPRFPRDNDSDEKSLKASPRDPRKNDWDERNPYRDNGSSNNKAPVRGPEWSDKGRNMSRDSDWNESTDRPSEAHEDEDIISEFDLNQPEKSNIKTRDHNSKPVDRVVSLPPPPHDLGYPEFDDKDLELANLKQLVEKLDMEEEEDINDENVPENFTDMTISRPDSIYISEDVWTQLENTMNGKMNNPFYLNPEERFKNDNNGADAKLAPIQEDELAELPELTHVEEKSKSLDDVSFQVTDNDRVLQSTVSETVTGNSPKPELPNTDSEIIEETSITDKKVLSSINTETIPEEPSPTNMPISNVSASELPLPASPVSSVGSGNSISGARDRALRRAERFNSGSPLPGAAQERRILLATLLARLHGYDTDVHLFRKLIRISKETQFSNRELAEDIWENGDRFIELMNALIGFLSDSEQQNNELREGAVLLLGQLINNQPDYTRGQERDILRILLECRADSASNICGHADDALDNYIQIVDANFGLYALIDIMESSLFNTFGNTSLPESNSPQFGSKTSMKGSAFVVLSKLVKRFDKRSLERQVGRVVPLAIKGFSDSKPEIRKSVVDALVAIYSVIGDDNTLFQYLGSLNAAQQNLLKYYFDKSRKQRRATSSPGRG
ncbi:13681_t:CDS:10, partial [Funneliformis geosporum]